MLTKLIIRNFKRFDEAVIELAEPVVFIGPKQFRQKHGITGAGIMGCRITRLAG